MLFSGSYEHSIDGKNRLAIPSQVRAKLERMGLGKKLYVALGPRPGTLAVWPEERFNAMSEQLPQSLIPDPDQLQYEQFFFATAHEVDLDSQGRILIPDALMELAKLSRQVIVSGARDHLEIWNKEDFQQFVRENWREYAAVQQKARMAILNNARSNPPPRDSQ